MDRSAVLERDHAEVAAAEFRHGGPEPNAVVLLGLNSDRLLHDRDAPRALEVRALPQYLPLEILGEAVLGLHGGKIASD